jgi:hypothetical protein
MFTVMLLSATASTQVFASEEFGSDADQYCPKLPEGSGSVLLRGWGQYYFGDNICVRFALTTQPAFRFIVLFRERIENR